MLFKDKIIFSPREIAASKYLIQAATGEPTYILGTFNPGLTRLPNGNLLLMVRVAEALKSTLDRNRFRLVQWIPKIGYHIEIFSATQLDTSDPRKFRFLNFHGVKVYGLTSFSWLLPVELSPDGFHIIQVHYDRVVQPQASFQEFGIEDARITRIENTYYMTTCSVSAERHATTLYQSKNGLDYELLGIILDHQNKDMVLFPEKINGKYYALTRPLGELYFHPGYNSNYLPGPSINLAESPDLVHWRPVGTPYIRACRGSKLTLKLGGGAPPIRTPKGWLILFHGVEQNGNVGIYRTFWALAKLTDPSEIIEIKTDQALLESNPVLTEPYQDLIYLRNIVFTTGIAEFNKHYIIASGELDLCCRITHLEKQFC
jgi:predicted GH43/DUF377 family glycosyl hydrolase